MKLPQVDVDRYTSTLPKCTWCGQPARFRFYSDQGRSTGCLLDFFSHREPRDTYAQLIVLSHEDAERVKADLEAEEVQGQTNDVDVFLFELEYGFYDDELDRILEKTKERIELRAKAQASLFRKGQKVKVVGELRPTYLIGAVGELLGKASGGKWSVKFEAGINRTFPIPVTFLRPVKEEAVA